MCQKNEILSQKEPSCIQITVSTVCIHLGSQHQSAISLPPFCLTPPAASNALQLAPFLPTCRPHMAQWTSNVLGHSSRGGPCAFKPTSLLTVLFHLVWQRAKNHYVTPIAGLVPLQDARRGRFLHVWWHAQKPDFVFRRNGRVHLNRQGRQFSRLLAAEVCASAVVMLDTPCSEVVWECWLLTPFASFPFNSPPVRHRVPSHFNWTLLR